MENQNSISTLCPIDKYVAHHDFTPSFEDIIGGEFTPPYRFIFEGQMYFEKEQTALETLKKSELYEKLDKSYWNDAMLLRNLQGCYYEQENAKLAIMNHDTWRQSNIEQFIPDDTLDLLV